MPYSEWDDNSTPIPSLDEMQYELSQKKPNPLDIVKAGIQNMPGASLAQGVAPLINFPFQVAGSALYGLGKQLISPSTADFNKDTTEAMKYLQYEPPTQAGKEVLETTGQLLEASKLPPYIGHMPPVRFNANDARVLAKQNIERAREVGRIPEDFRNAQEGVRRESPLGGETYGSQLQRVAEDIGDVTARRQAMGKSSFAGVPEGMVEVFDPKLYAVRNTGEGQMLRPTTSPAGMTPKGVDYGETEDYLREISPRLSADRPQDILDDYERTYMTDNTPQARQLNLDWERFQTGKIQELYPQFSQSDAFKAFRTGYPSNAMNDMKLKWFHDFVAQEKAKGATIPTMDEYFTRAQAAHTLTKKIIPNIIQKYIGTPNDPFLELAKQGITMNPAEELVDKYTTTPTDLEATRRQAGFEPQGEVAGKLIPVAESKLATQTSELDNLISEQAEIGRTEGMQVPYPDNRIDPETGQVAMATNPNYAKYTNKIGALRKAIEDTEEQIRNLKTAQAYENVSDASIRQAQAFEYRNRIPAEYQQFYPSLFAEKPLATPEAEREFKTPATAPFFEANVHGLTRAGILPLAKELVGKIMAGEIPPEQVPTLSQPHTITKFMADIVAPRLEKEKAARLAQVNYKQNVENHFKFVVDNEAGTPIGGNAKLLWIDDGFDADFINQALSDETFVLDHCIGQAGSGRGLKNLFTGDERQYIPYLDPATGQPFKNASGTSSYMDRIESGDLDIMSIRDDKTGLPVGTIELSKSLDDNDEPMYDIGYVSGYKNRAIDPKYREALRDALNKVKDSVNSSEGNETKSGVYDIKDADQLTKLTRELTIPGKTDTEKRGAWKGIKQNIIDTLDGDRYFTIDSAKQAVEDYKQANPPPVPAVRSGFPPAGKEITERNIVMQGLSRENMNVTRQFNASNIVANNNRFVNLPNTSTMDEGPRTALQTILRSEEHRAGTQGISDYQLFRNLQDYIDQINNGVLRFADFGLRNGSELLELETGLQRHADAVGQLAHYADVLERNGIHTPLATERTGAPEWQAYQQDITNPDMRTIDNPEDLKTRLLDRINFGDIQGDHPNLDDIQRENYKHLLQMHVRSLDQMQKYPAPTAPAQQRGIPLEQWTDMVGQTLDRIQFDHGENVRNRVAGVLAEAIGSQMDTPVNERPVQVSNFLATQREGINSQQVRSALRTLESAIDQANADVQNARNAPATALPTSEDFRNALLAAMNDIPANSWADVFPVYERVTSEINNAGGIHTQQPVTVANRLNEEANYYDGEGEPNTAEGLRNLANRIAQLAPATPPASMALANQPRMIAAGAENTTLQDAVEARLETIREQFDPELSQAVFRMLDAHNYRHDIQANPTALARALRRESEELFQAGDNQFGQAILDIVRDIESIQRNPTRQLVTGREALSNSILDAMNEIPFFAPAISDRLNALQWRENLVNDPAGLIRNIRIEADAEANAGNEQLASQFYDIANLIADERGETLFTPAGREAVEPRNTPRDIAETVSAPAHQTLTQRIAQVDALANGINEEIRSIPTDIVGLRQAEMFYSDPNNLPASIVDYTHQFEDAERIANYLLQHVHFRMVNQNQPQNQGQLFDDALERVSNELRNTYTDSYIRQFQIGDADVRREVLRDVQDRPAVYGLARVPPNIQTQVIAHLRNEGLPETWEAEEPQRLPEPAQTEDPFFPNTEQFRTISRMHANEFTGAQDAFYRLGRELRGMNSDQRMEALNRHIADTGQRAELDAGQRATYGVDSPAGMNQLNRSLRALRTDLEDRNLLRELQPPAENNQIEQQNQRISDAIVQRAELVNQNHLGISQRFDTIVRVAANEANPQTDTVNFISSLHHRANSVDRAGDREAMMLANQLRHLAADVNDVLHTQAPALPAPDQANQHWNRVEQGVNQPEGMGALNTGERGTVVMYSTNLLNGDRNALTGLAPAERQMIEVLTRYREPEPTLINELVHRRLINTLTSETYNPATDGEALIRLADTRSGMFAELDDPAREQVKDIVNKWNFIRFPNYRPPEEGMGLEPEGHKRGGVIRRKMNEGGEPPKLTPYEQFKIDNAERIRQGQEDIANRNKYDPYKGSDRPVPTPKASVPRGATGSAGTIPSGSGTTLLDRPHLYSIGGKVYMEVGGGVKPVPNIPQTPEKTNPNTTDHVIKRPVDEGFREVLERVRNTPKPSGSAGTMPSGNGASYLDRPHLYSEGGKAILPELLLENEKPSTAPVRVHGFSSPYTNPNVPMNAGMPTPKVSGVHVGHDINTDYGKFSFGSTGMSANGRERVVGVDLGYESPEGFYAKYNRPTNSPAPARYEMGYRHSFQSGGRVRMNEGGLPQEGLTGEANYGAMGHSGIDPLQNTKVPAEYARSGLPEVSGDPYDVWETKYNLNQATRDKLNFNDPAYTLGIKEVKVSTPMEDSWGGFHSSAEPDVVNIKNIHGEPQFYSQTLTHEGQHLQDYKTDQNKFRPKGHIDAMEYLYKTGNQYLNQRAIENNYQAYRDKWVAEHPDEMPYNKLGAYWNDNNAPWGERIADLNSLEGELKRGQRFADTEMGRAILNTPELQNYYYQSVRPMEAKALPYEPTVFDRIRNAGRNFQEKVGSGKSFVDSAYESAKEFKDGGDVNIDAMRLALTKG
jgi:hypothetical protein